MKVLDMRIPYSFSGHVWKYSGKGAWFFISLPKFLSEQIRVENQQLEEGWGRLKCIAKIGEVTWETAIWFDTKQACYLLPVKADVRKKENLLENATVKVEIWI